MTETKRIRLRNPMITAFVIAWLIIFNYESTRRFYLNPLAGRELPKLKFLFPPAGWIMFYNVDDTYGSAEVYGLKGNEEIFIDPHRIFETRNVLYDNIHRNVLSGVLYADTAGPFCNYLKRKFPEYESFRVKLVHYPSIVKKPLEKISRTLYQCP